MSDFSYNKLRDIQHEERGSAALSKLPDDFYERMGSLVCESKEAAASTRSLAQIREYENTLKILRDIVQMREQKIAFRALRAKGGEHDASGMTKDEHDLYDRFLNLVEWNRKRFEGVLWGEAALAAPKPQRGEGTFKRVRFLKDIPAYRGSDEATYGPFKLGEEHALPPHEVEWLVKGRMADPLP